MGMLDSNMIFAEAQAVTATGDTGSTNSYNTGGANGQGDVGMTFEGLWVNAVCTTAVTSAGAATVQAVLQSSPDNATWTDAAAGPVIAKANLTAPTTMLLVQPPPGMQQYWRVAWRVGTAALTAGAFDAWISNTISYNIPRASGYTVS